jgi:hypothetical protein
MRQNLPAPLGLNSIAILSQYHILAPLIVGVLPRFPSDLTELKLTRI